MSTEQPHRGDPARVRARLRRPSSAGPPLRALLLHGLGGNSSVWRALAERACERLELWDADLPWGSDTATGWAYDPDLGAWVAQAMASMADGRPDVVIAHSFAATTLLEVLDRGETEWPAAVVLVSPFYRAAPEHFDWQSLRNSLDVFPRLLEEGVGLHARRSLAPGVRADMARHILGRIGPYGWASFLNLYLRSPRLHAGRLRLPFLIVSGERDDAAVPADSRALCRALPDCRLELFAGCGHFPMTEQPDRFARLLTDFLDTVLGVAPCGADQLSH